MIDGTFIVAFEYVAANGDTIRSEHKYGPAFLTIENQAAAVAKKASELQGKVINAMKEDGVIPPPGNVIRVDFQNRKRVAA
jgi:hypothetical protein